MNKRIALLASGTGSLAEAIIAEGIPVDLILTDRECRAFNGIATDKHHIVRKMLPRSFREDFDRPAYTKNVVDVLLEHEIDLVVMAGFMTIFAPGIFDHFGGRIINIHPSLLPKFKGEHAVRDALASSEQITGTTIHIATAELDDGPILAQREVPILPRDTRDTLHERIKEEERKLFPVVIRTFLERM